MTPAASVDFEISDIMFYVTRHGNIKPVIVFEGAKELNLEISNIPQLINAGIMIGDIVSVSSLHDDEMVVYDDIMMVNYREGLDRSPPIIPTHCPCCGTELTMIVGRHTVLQCHNAIGCSAQAKEVIR